MPNATITLEKIVAGKQGWDAFTTDAKKLWIPPTKYKSEESNEPFMKSLKIGEPIEVGLSKDGTIIVGPAGSGKDGKPRGDFETGPQRKAKIESYEALQVLGTARQMIADMVTPTISAGFTDLDVRLDGIERAYPRLLALVRANRSDYVVESVGATSGVDASPSETAGAKTGGDRAGSDRHAAPATSRAAEEMGAMGKRNPPPPSEESQRAEIVATIYDIEAQWSHAADLYGSRALVFRAAREAWPSRNLLGPEQVTEDDLVELILRKTR